MEGILPLNVFVDIFTRYLGVDDLINVYKTCIYWRTIIDNFKIWEKHWTRLLIKTEKTCLKTHIKPDFYNPEQCVKLNRMLSNKCGNKPVDLTVLKTHHSHQLYKYYNTNTLLFRKLITNKKKPNEDDYRNFRSQIVENSDCVMLSSKNKHLHVIKQFWYIYPMELGSHVQEFIKHMFDVYHIQEIVFVPRVLMLCENLDVLDAVVVFSTSQSTEIAVILNGKVVRFRECLVGGWAVSKNLHEAVKWIYPHVVKDVTELEQRNFKDLCWIKPRKYMSSSNPEVQQQIDDNYFTLKKEQYLAAELMYNELGLCEVVQQLLEDFCDEEVARCLRHVFLTGGNCKLKYLDTRIKLDLIEAFPKHKYVISTSVHCAQSMIYGISNNIYENISWLKTERKFTPGTICKIRIEDYVENLFNISI